MGFSLPQHALSPDINLRASQHFRDIKSKEESGQWKMGGKRPLPLSVPLSFFPHNEFPPIASAQILLHSSSDQKRGGGGGSP